MKLTKKLAGLGLAAAIGVASATHAVSDWYQRKIEGNKAFLDRTTISKVMDTMYNHPEVKITEKGNKRILKFDNINSGELDLKAGLGMQSGEFYNVDLVDHAPFGEVSRGDYLSGTRRLPGSFTNFGSTVKRDSFFPPTAKVEQSLWRDLPGYNRQVAERFNAYLGKR